MLTLLLVLVAATTVNGQDIPCVTPHMDQPIAIHPNAGTLGEVLAGVGRDSGICFGLDIRDRTVLKERFSLDGSQNTLHKILAALGPRARSYVEGELVLIQIGTAARKDWLDTTINAFHTEKAVIELASAKVFEYLFWRANPGVGTVGSTLSSFDSPQVRPFAAKRRTVSSLLTLIVVNSARSGMWFTAGPHAAQSPLPSRQFWDVLIYSDPPARNQARISEAMRQY